MIGRINYKEDRVSRKRKIYMIVLFILLVLFFGFFLMNPQLTWFSIKDHEEDSESVLIPEVVDGFEKVYLGYKYSNSSGIIVSSENYVSCRWKPDNRDDGWKICEVIFEVDNQK